MLRIFGLTVAFFCLVFVACLGTLAIYFSNLLPALRMLASGNFALAAVSLIVYGLRKNKRWAWGAFLILFMR